MIKLFKTSVVILAVLLISSCETESVTDTNDSQNMTIVTENQTRVELQSAYMEWREGLTEEDINRKREYYQERGFLIVHIICDEDEDGVKGETWTYDDDCPNCRKKPQVNPPSDPDVERWVVNGDCDEN